MDNATSTLALKGFTPYAQVPRWVLRSGKHLSLGARSLYGVIMTYAANDTHAAFPSRETLAGDLGVSVRSVGTYIGELEKFGALTVERRRNKRTGNFYANHYVLIFEEPGTTMQQTPSEAPGLPIDLQELVNAQVGPQEAHFPRREEAHFPITTPTSSTTPTPLPTVASTASDGAETSSSLRSPSLSERRTHQQIIQRVRDIVQAGSDEDEEKAVDAFLEDYQDAYGLEPGYWDYGWDTRLYGLVGRHGLEYGTAKWLGIFRNSAQAA